MGGLSWRRIIANLGGAAALCFGAHQAGQVVASGAIPPPSVFGVIVCMLANLVGLFQTPPQNQAPPGLGGRQ